VNIAVLRLSPSIASGKNCINELRSVLALLSSSVNFIIIVGNFNINMLNINDAVTKEYVDLLSDFQLVQHVKDPTRIGGSSATLIDHIISSNSLTVTSVFQVSGISDHRMQVSEFTIAPVQLPSRSVCVRSFKKCDWKELRATLRSAPWNLMEMFDNIDDNWSFFHTLIMQVFDDLMPLHRVSCHHLKRSTPWFTDEISKLISIKNKSRCKADKSKEPEDRVTF